MIIMIANGSNDNVHSTISAINFDAISCGQGIDQDMGYPVRIFCLILFWNNQNYVYRY